MAGPILILILILILLFLFRGQRRGGGDRTRFAYDKLEDSCEWRANAFARYTIAM
jgi:cbb3-type cytochrome oxidase subunit 3